MSTSVPVPKHWIGFGYLFSKDNELDMSFDET